MSEKESDNPKSDEKKSANSRSKSEKTEPWVSEESISNFLGRVSGATTSAFKFAKKTGGTSYKVGKAIIQSQDQLKLMVSAGQSLKDLREVAGLTVSELSEAVNLKDKSVIEAVENGTATLSFELILRLAALLARNDPIPFILKYSRTYAPDTWKILNDWGAGRLPLHYERERQFINIYRSQDQARQLSDEGYERVLEFTKQAFNMSLHFIAEQEDALQEMIETQEEQMEVLRSKMSQVHKHKTQAPSDDSDAKQNSDETPAEGKPNEQQKDAP
jgi:transcriptional regulator with XRE-family HTH domain